MLAALRMRYSPDLYEPLVSCLRPWMPPSSSYTQPHLRSVSLQRRSPVDDIRNINITRLPSGYSIDQAEYVRRLLRRHGYDSVSASTTPLETNFHELVLRMTILKVGASFPLNSPNPGLSSVNLVSFAFRNTRPDIVHACREQSFHRRDTLDTKIIEKSGSCSSLPQTHALISTGFPSQPPALTNSRCLR